MRSLSSFGKSSMLPAIAVVLLALWSFSALERLHTLSPAWWAALLLLGAFGLSGLTPRIAVAGLYGAFLLQLSRAVCRFDEEGWLPYGAIVLVALVVSARTVGPARRRYLAALLPLAPLVGLFTNLPVLGPPTDLGRTYGLVNGLSPGPGGFGDPLDVFAGVAFWTAGTALLIAAGWGVGSAVRDRDAAEAEALAARAALSESALQLRVNEERDRIAQDVHDITAHSLSVILAQADGAAAHGTDATTRAALSTIATSARQALTELRGLLEQLDHRTDGDTAYSTADLPELVDLAGRGGAMVEYEVTGEPVPLSKAAGLAAYRIVQEGITNALRHGAAERGPVRVVLDWGDDGLALVVASPVAPDAPRPSSLGRGLIGMQERARLAGGWLTSGVDGESGTYLVTAHLPKQASVLA